MDADERPSKLRKIDHDTLPAEPAAAPDQLSSMPTTEKATGIGSAQDLLRSDDADPKQEDEAGESLLAPAYFTSTVDESTADAPAMSKNQLKKLRKKQEWESKRDERKVIRKEKAVAKRERKREAKQKAAAEGGEEYEAEKKKQQVRAIQLPVTFIIDCDFDDLMRDNERVSLGSQLTRSYSDNKNSKFRAHITISSWGGQLRERFENVMGGMHNLWRGTRFLDEDFVETSDKAKDWMSEKEGGLLKGAFSKYESLDEAAKEELKQQGEVVYLSSESDNTLTELKPYSTYIIGGLVDKNREKGLCYKRATQRGIRTAKLPIGQYLEMSSRKVLATNHVNEIMLRWLECGDWGDAFMQVIPKRKGGKLREASGEKEASADASDEEDDAVENVKETEDADARAVAESDTRK